MPDGFYGHLHNIYLQYAAERGIPTMLAMMWLIGKVLWDFAAALRSKLVSAEARFVLHGAIAAILAILAEGFLEFNLGDSEVLTLFLAVVGFRLHRPGGNAREKPLRWLKTIMSTAVSSTGQHEDPGKDGIHRIADD